MGQRVAVRVASPLARTVRRREIDSPTHQENPMSGSHDADTPGRAGLNDDLKTVTTTRPTRNFWAGLRRFRPCRGHRAAHRPEHGLGAHALADLSLQRTAVAVPVRLRAGRCHTGAVGPTTGTPRTCPHQPSTDQTSAAEASEDIDPKTVRGSRGGRSRRPRCRVASCGRDEAQGLSEALGAGDRYTVVPACLPHFGGRNDEQVGAGAVGGDGLLGDPADRAYGSGDVDGAGRGYGPAGRVVLAVQEVGDRQSVREAGRGARDVASLGEPDLERQGDAEGVSN